MYERVAVDLAGGCVQHHRLCLEGEIEHVHNAEHGALGRLHRVLLVVDGRCGAGEVVYLVELSPERLRDVVQHERELRVAEEVVDVGLGAGEEVVEGRHLVSVGKQPAAEMRTQKPGGAGDKGLLGQFHLLSSFQCIDFQPWRAPASQGYLNFNSTSTSCDFADSSVTASTCPPDSVRVSTFTPFGTRTPSNLKLSGMA